MLNTAISDSGAIPFPTEITSPIVPFFASLSIFGVTAASNGVFPFKSGCGRSPTPSNKTYTKCTSEFSVMTCQLLFLTTLQVHFKSSR